MTFLLIYLCVAIVCWLPFAKVVVRHDEKDYMRKADTEDYAMAAFAAFFAALMWPLMLLTCWLMRVLRNYCEQDKS